MKIRDFFNSDEKKTIIEEKKEKDGKEIETKKQVVLKELYNAQEPIYYNIDTDGDINAFRGSKINQREANPKYKKLIDQIKTLMDGIVKAIEDKKLLPEKQTQVKKLWEDLYEKLADPDVLSADVVFPYLENGKKYFEEIYYNIMVNSNKTSVKQLIASLHISGVLDMCGTGAFTKIEAIVKLLQNPGLTIEDHFYQAVEKAVESKIAAFYNNDILNKFDNATEGNEVHYVNLMLDHLIDSKQLPVTLRHRSDAFAFDLQPVPEPLLAKLKKQISEDPAIIDDVIRELTNIYYSMMKDVSTFNEANQFINKISSEKEPKRFEPMFIDLFSIYVKDEKNNYVIDIESESIDIKPLDQLKETSASPKTIKTTAQIKESLKLFILLKLCEKQRISPDNLLRYIFSHNLSSLMTVRFLLDAEANINMPLDGGISALIYAVNNHQTDVVKALIEVKAKGVSGLYFDPEQKQYRHLVPPHWLNDELKESKSSFDFSVWQTIPDKEFVLLRLLNDNELPTEHVNSLLDAISHGKIINRTRTEKSGEYVAALLKLCELERISPDSLFRYLLSQNLLNPKAVQFLHGAKANINMPLGGTTALIYAVNNHQTDVVTALIEAKVKGVLGLYFEPEQKQYHYLVPPHWLNAEIKATTITNFDFSVWQTIPDEKFINVLFRLLNELPIEHINPLLEAIPQSKIINMTRKYVTALLALCEQQRISPDSLFRYLLSHNLLNPTAVQALHKAEANINMLLGGITALIDAVNNHQTDIVKALIEVKAKGSSGFYFHPEQKQYCYLLPPHWLNDELKESKKALFDFSVWKTIPDEVFLNVLIPLLNELPIEHINALLDAMPHDKIINMTSVEKGEKYTKALSNINDENKRKFIIKKISDIVSPEEKKEEKVTEEKTALVNVTVDVPADVMNIMLEYDNSDKLISHGSIPLVSTLFNSRSARSARLKDLLTAIVNGEFDKTKAMLEKEPSLLLEKLEEKDYVVALSGQKSNNATAYRTALAVEDHEIANMIKAKLIEIAGEDVAKAQYDEQFPKGWEAAERKRWAPLFNRLLTLTRVIDGAKKGVDFYDEYPSPILIEGSDVAAALAQFRLLLDTKLNDIVTTGRHFNPNLLLDAFRTYDDHCENKPYDYIGTGFSDEDPRVKIFWQKVIGTIERGLPVNYVQGFANGLRSTIAKIQHDVPQGRSFKIDDFYPLSGSRLGFDYAIPCTSSGVDAIGRVREYLGRPGTFFYAYVYEKRLALYPPPSGVLELRMIYRL